MKKYDYLIACAVVLTISCNQKPRNANSELVQDSVNFYLEEFKKSTDEKTRLFSNRRAFEKLLKESNTFLKRKRLAQIADNFYKLNDKNTFRAVNNVLLDNSLHANDTTNIAKSYKNFGTYYIDMNQNDSSFYYYLKAEKLCYLLNDTVSLGEIFIDKAFIQLYESDFLGSEISAFKSLNFLSFNGSKLKIYDAYNLIGICSNELKNYERALEYHNKALNYLKENNLKNKYHLDASSLNNIGYVYQNMNRDREAIYHFNVALADPTLFKDNPSLYAMLLDNLAYSKFKLKDFTELPNLFFKSLKIRDSLRLDLSGIILSKIHLSELFSAQGDTINARIFAKEALDFSRETKVSSDILMSLQHLASIEPTSAAKYSKEYIRINDSLQQKERIAKDRFARIAFETDEIILQKDKLAEQNRSLLYFFVFTLFTGVLLFVIRAQRAKNRELLLIQAQQKANEDIYNLMISQQETIEENRVKEKKRISRELHDGVLGRLFGARLNLDSLNRAIDDESIRNRFNYLSELKNIEQDIREISHDLNREKDVLINNFVAIVNNLIDEQKNSFKANVSIKIDDNILWDQVSNLLKINLYRVLQESLQNINKYAQAQNVQIGFHKDGELIRLKISDDGIGFDVGTKKKGIGLQNMLSRANECDGSFEIKSKKGRGTTIIVTVPLN